MAHVRPDPERRIDREDSRPSRAQIDDRHQQVYRHQLRSVIETGATTMNTIFNRQKNTGSV